MDRTVVHHTHNPMVWGLHDLAVDPLPIYSFQHSGFPLDFRHRCNIFDLNHRGEKRVENEKAWGNLEVLQVTGFVLSS